MNGRVRLFSYSSQALETEPHGIGDTETTCVYSI